METILHPTMLFHVSTAVSNYVARGRLYKPNPNLHPGPDPLKFPGDDGEGPDGAGSFQFQGCQEAVWGLAGAPRLQGLAQAAPRLV